MTREEFLKQLPELVDNYQTSTEVLERMAHITLLMIIGPSGVGKTSIIKRLNIPYVAGDTTRPERPEEIEGQDYFFRTDYDKLAYDIKNGSFVQVAVGPAGDFYGTRASSYPAFGLAVYAVVADVIPEFRTLGFERTIAAYIVPPSLQDWMHRMEAHKLSPQGLEKRMAEAKRSLNFAINDKQTYFILNDQIDGAVLQTNSLVGGKVNDIRQNYAREIAQQLYEELMST